MKRSLFWSPAIRSVSCAVVSLFISGSAFAQNTVAANFPLPPGESERIDAYLAKYMSGVIVTKTTTSRFGEPVSCVDIRHQPGSDGQPIQMQPSPQLVAMLGGHVAVDTMPTQCPTGSVEMMLPTKEQIARAGSLQNFLNVIPPQVAVPGMQVHQASTVAGSATLAADTYNSSNGQLTIPYVYYGNTMYSNVLVTLGAVKSVGAFPASKPFDTYDGTNLTIPSVLSNGSTYNNVVITVGRVLGVGGSTTEFGTGSFYAASSPVTSRLYDTATLLPNGKVLVAGGQNPQNTNGIFNNSTKLSGAELYDPVTNSWSATGSLITGRDQHTATLLPNGKVLVAGGYPSVVLSAPLASAELYDPASNSWSAAGSLITGRGQHTATLLPNGKVLVAGGVASNQLASPELYDPATNTWSAAGNLIGRIGHTATLLPNGKVLVAGGYAPTFSGSVQLASAELYDPATNTWSAAGSLINARNSHIATLLPNGKVLVAGGSASSVQLASAELYDPAANTWSAAGSLITGRDQHTATLLPDGKVLVAGGHAAPPAGILTRAELYDPATNTWSATGSLINALSLNTATLLPNGNVLVEGSSNLLPSAELYVHLATDVAFMTFDNNWNSGITTVQNIVIRDQAAWSDLWIKLMGNPPPLLGAYIADIISRPLPPVDFTKNMVLGVFAGSYPNGCYSLSITKVSQINLDMMVEYHIATPSAGTLCTQNIVYPSQLILVPLTSGSVSFVQK